jgi:hypothetical protein
MQTHKEHSRDILLGCLKLENIVTREAAESRREIEAKGPLPTNRPLITYSIGRSERSEDSWAKELGLDRSNPGQVAVFEAARALENAQAATSTDTLVREALAKRWTNLVTLHDALLKHTEASENLRRHAWDVLSTDLSKAAEACDNPQHLELFPGLLSMVVHVLELAQWPAHKADPVAEAEFERLPSWGNAPRISAASALVAWVQVAGSLSEELRARIQNLSRDASPAVRYQVLARVNAFVNLAPDFMWELCSDAFAQEQNRSVLSFFLAACRPILHLRPTWFAERILPIEERYAADTDDGREYGRLLVDLILRLWLVHEQHSAGERVLMWVQNPLPHSHRVLNALQLLRNELAQKSAMDLEPTAERTRRAAFTFFRDIVATVVPRFTELVITTTSDSARQQEAEKALRILDTAMMQIYFASGAFDSKKTGRDNAILRGKARQRFLDEVWPILEMLASVAYPSVTHHFLETLEHFIQDAPERVFRLLVHGLTHGGAHGGYQRESMGADLFVRIVRRYLADYRDVLTGDPICRRGLVIALDQFVQVGWPEARRLVYELPEMLR